MTDDTAKINNELNGNDENHVNSSTDASDHAPLDHPMAPDTSDVPRVWRLATLTEDDEDVRDGVLTITAQFIGFGTSKKPRHRFHDGRAYAQTTESCGLCRWFETRIFKIDTDDYVLHHVGVSTVPGEVNFPRHERVYSPTAVLESYVVRPRPNDSNQQPYLPRPSAQALALAVDFDPELAERYDRRAVS